MASGASGRGGGPIHSNTDVPACEITVGDGKLSTMTQAGGGGGEGGGVRDIMQLIYEFSKATGSSSFPSDGSPLHIDSS